MTLAMIQSRSESHAKELAKHRTEVEARILARIHAIQSKRALSLKLRKAELETFQRDLGITGRDFAKRAQVGKIFLGQLHLSERELVDFGFDKAQLLCKPLKDLLSGNDQDQSLAHRLLQRAHSLPISDLNATSIAQLKRDVLDNPDDPSWERGLARNSSVVGTHERILGTLVSQILQGPSSRFPPAPDDFIVTSQHWRQLVLAAQLGSNVLLEGPAGCGKTELVKRLAVQTRRPLEIVSFGALQEPRLSLVGAIHYRTDRGTFFVPSRFCQAIQQKNTIVCLDELNRCQETNILLSLLDGQRTLSLDEAEGAPQVRVASGVTFIACANIGVRQYSGTHPIDQALRDRFETVLKLDYPPADQEADLLRREHGISAKEAALIAMIVSRQRELADAGEFSFPVSTRMTLAVSRQLALGIPLEEALHFSISNHFSSESANFSDHVRFRQLLQRFGVSAP